VAHWATPSYAYAHVMGPLNTSRAEGNARSRGTIHSDPVLCEANATQEQLLLLLRCSDMLLIQLQLCSSEQFSLFSAWLGASSPWLLQRGLGCRAGFAAGRP
jgi:hypothetical protein